MKPTLLIKADLASKAEHIHPQHVQTLSLSVLKMAQAACDQLPRQSAPAQTCFFLPLEVTMSSDQMEKLSNFLVHEVKNDPALL